MNKIPHINKTAVEFNGGLKFPAAFSVCAKLC